MTDYQQELSTLKQILDELDELTKFENLSSDNSKRSRLLGKKAENITKKLIQTTEGVRKYLACLNSNDINLIWNAALNLFPLFPTLCCKTMIECEKKCDDFLKKSAMKDVLYNYSSPLESKNIFYEKLRKLYNVNDLTTLNREK